METMRLRPRVLHVGPMPPPEGGIGAVIGGILRSPVAARFDLSVLDVNVPPAARRHRALRAGQSAAFLARLDQRLRRERPDLVHIHVAEMSGFYEKAAFGALASRHRVPWLMHLHGGRFLPALEGLGGCSRRLMAATLRRAAATLIPTASWQPAFSHLVPAGRLAILPNAIHVGDFSPRTTAPHGPPVRVLFLGMLSPRKGLDDLLRALLELKRHETPPFELDIVGGEERPGELRRYQGLYARAGLASQVHFHGERTGVDKQRFLQAADCFVLPSRSESFGIANLEAMASGLAVLSTRTGAIPEYLEDGETGLLVEPGGWHALATALRRLIGDSLLRTRLGQNARRRVQDFDWAIVGPKLVEIYFRCLGHPPGEWERVS